MDPHDPIDLTDWDDADIHDADMIRVPHESLPGRAWCYKQNTLSTWRQINPDINLRTNQPWTPAQLAQMDVHLPILINTTSSEGSVQSEDDLLVQAEYWSWPIDFFFIDVPESNEDVAEVQSMKVSKSGVIQNWPSVPVWLKRKLTNPNQQGMQRVFVNDTFRMRIQSTNDEGDDVFAEQVGLVPQSLFQANYAPQVTEATYLTFGLQSTTGPKRIVNWAARDLTIEQIWQNLDQAGMVTIEE